MRAASSGRPLSQLARKMSPKSELTVAQPTASPLSGSLGVVATLNSDGTADVTYNGGPIPCNLVGDFVPVVGQSVLVLIEGERNWVIGPVATGAPVAQDVCSSPLAGTVSPDAPWIEQSGFLSIATDSDGRYHLIYPEGFINCVADIQITNVIATGWGNISAFWTVDKATGVSLTSCYLLATNISADAAYASSNLSFSFKIKGN
jgi:hypothetical protein